MKTTGFVVCVAVGVVGCNVGDSSCPTGECELASDSSSLCDSLRAIYGEPGSSTPLVQFDVLGRIDKAVGIELEVLPGSFTTASELQCDLQAKTATLSIHYVNITRQTTPTLTEMLRSYGYGKWTFTQDASGWVTASFENIAGDNPIKGPLAVTFGTDSMTTTMTTDDPTNQTCGEPCRVEIITTNAKRLGAVRTIMSMKLTLFNSGQVSETPLAVRKTSNVTEAFFGPRPVCGEGLRCGTSPAADMTTECLSLTGTTTAYGWYCACTLNRASGLCE